MRFEQLTLRVPQLQAPRREHLSNLATDGVRVDAVEQSRKLHRDGGGALARAATCVGDGGAHDRRAINSKVMIEVLVFMQQQRLDERR